MDTIRQRTIEGVKYTLERESTDEPGKQYEYYIRAGKGQSGRTKRFNPNQSYFRRADAEPRYNEIVSGKQESAGKIRSRSRGKSRDTSDSSGGMGLDLGLGGGFGGGGGPAIPGFGMQTDESDDEDEDGGFNFPGF